MTRDEIVEGFAMLADGHTYAEIGEKFGVSRQRVYQVFNGYFAQQSYRSEKLTDGCIYPNLAYEINERRMDGKRLYAVLYPDRNSSSYTTKRMKRSLQGKRSFTAWEWMKMAEFFRKSVEYLMEGCAAVKEMEDKEMEATP